MFRGGRTALNRISEQLVYQGQNPTVRQYCREITLLYLKERSQDDPKAKLVCVELMMANWGPPCTAGWKESSGRISKGGRHPRPDVGFIRKKNFWKGSGQGHEFMK